jgi:hypothetical protein
MENWIPVSDIMKIAEPIKTAVSMVTPIFKAPLENWANYNTFFRSEIEKFPGEKGNFFGIDFRKRAELNPLELLDVVQEKGLGEGVKSLVGIDMLRNLRILNEIDKLNPWNIFGVDRPHKVDPSQLQRWLQLFIGKLQKYDREKAFNYYNYRVNKRLGKLKGSLNKAKRENNEAEISQLTADIKNLKQELMKAKSDFERGK